MKKEMFDLDVQITMTNQPDDHRLTDLSMNPPCPVAYGCNDTHDYACLSANPPCPI